MWNGYLAIAKTSVERFKEKIRGITKRNRGVKLEEIIKELNQVITGWMHYFKLHTGKNTTEKLDGWIRMKVRCYRLKQYKRGKTICKLLVASGIQHSSAAKAAYSGCGWWRKSVLPQMHYAMSTGWTITVGLKSLRQVQKSL